MPVSDGRGGAGDRGESTVTTGGDVGGDKGPMDIGRGLEYVDWGVRGVTAPGVRGPSLLTSAVRGGDCLDPFGRGRSNETRPPNLARWSSGTVGLSRNGEGWRDVGRVGD